MSAHTQVVYITAMASGQSVGCAGNRAGGDGRKPDPRVPAVLRHADGPVVRSRILPGYGTGKALVLNDNPVVWAAKGRPAAAKEA